MTQAAIAVQLVVQAGVGGLFEPTRAPSTKPVQRVHDAPARAKTSMVVISHVDAGYVGRFRIGAAERTCFCRSVVLFQMNHITTASQD